MASSPFLTSIRSPAVIENRKVAGSSSIGIHKSSFLQNSKLLFPSSSSLGRKPKSITSTTRCYRARKGNSLDHIPKKFREENLNDGLMDNYKNIPQYLYGLNPSQMNMFMAEDSPVRRQAEKVTEETISSAYNYLNNGGMYSLSGMNEKGPSIYSKSASMYLARGRGSGRRRSAPPDLPSLLLDSRIVYLGMPIVPAVTELIVAEFMWLDFDSVTEPIYLYINSPGTLNEKGEIVGSELDAYTIVDCMHFCKAPVYTVNVAMAYGQAGMLLSLGAKGYRALQPNCATKLYLPKMGRSSGAVTDMWIQARELDVSADTYIKLLAIGTGKTKEEIHEDVEFGKFFGPQEAIDYGLADRIIDPREGSLAKQKNYDEMLAESRATSRQFPRAATGAAASSF